MNRHNDLLKQMASLYAEKYGEELKKELPEAKTDVSEDFKKKVDAKVRRYKYKKYGPWAAAACFLLIFSIPLLKNTGNDILYENTDESGKSAQASYEAAEDTYEFIQLSFEMPEGFEVYDTDQDLGKSIYYVADAYGDDIVLTAEIYDDGKESEFEGLLKYDINDSTVYLASNTDYKIVKFEKENILYSLTCKYEINTLVYFCENII